MNISILANVPLDPNQGSGYVICGYAKCLRELGHSVDLHTAFPKKSFRGGRGTRFRTRLAMLRSLPLAAKSDALLLWGGEASWIVPRLKALKERGAIIACSNGLDAHYAQANGAAHSDRNNLDACFRELDGLMMVSQFDGDFAATMGYLTPSQRVIIPNPLPDQFIGREVQQKNPNLVLFVGNWLPNKGDSSVSEMIRYVSTKFPDVRIRLIGRGTSKALKSLSLPNVETLDPGVPRESLMTHYEDASILVMPSRYESFGMVATEAMACGCAIVATKTGFPYGLEHEKEVLHVPFGNSDALANAVLRLFRDGDLRVKISRAGHSRVQNLTWENAGQEMDKFIHRIVELRRR